ncbi:MAG: hypothetical protein K2X77_20090 [Candidatus Obscuribacterales bacterium]|nr:hypothetical protein [Candidatus Obscuribacterales bacterium]
MTILKYLGCLSRIAALLFLVPIAGVLVSHPMQRLGIYFDEAFTGAMLWLFTIIIAGTFLRFFSKQQTPALKPARYSTIGWYGDTLKGIPKLKPIISKK